MIKFFFITVCALVLCSHAVDSLKCYMCTSSDQPDCTSRDPNVLQKYEINCSTPGIREALRTVVGNHPVDRCATTIKDGETSRSCFFRHPSMVDNSCKSRATTTACIWDTNLCNHER